MVLEVLTSKEGDTWTMILNRPDGKACGLISGAFWQPVEFLLDVRGVEEGL